MPKKPGKRGATKRSRAKPAKVAKPVKAKRGTSGASRAKRADATTPQSAKADAETEYFHRTLRENAQIGSDALLSPGQTHVESTDAEGRPAIVRKRFSAI